MITAIVTIVGGAVLSGLSLLRDIGDRCFDADTTLRACQIVGDKDGYPISFIQDAPISEGSRELIENQLQVGPALANFIFWAIIAFILFKILSWVFEKFSIIAFVAVIVIVVAAYVGVVQPI